MKRTIISLFILIALGAQAQEIRYKSVVDQVATGPLAMSLYEQNMAAYTGIYTEPLLANPEVEGAYLLGAPGSIGNRWDLGVSQEFEFPTAYRHKKKLRELQANSIMLDFTRRRMELCREAQDICADLVYFNGLIVLLQNSYNSASEMVALYEKRMQSGDCSILDYNRVQLEMADKQKELMLAQTERDMLLSDLRMLSGNMELTFSQSTYEPVRITYLPEQYVENHPDVKEQRNQLRIDSTEWRLARAHRLPDFTVGYSSENEATEAFRGVKVGLSIPLWKNRGAECKAVCQMASTKMLLEISERRTRNHVDALYNKAMTLNGYAENMQNILNENNGEELLKKAFDAQELPLERYLLDQDSYNDNRKSLLEVQRELEHVILELEEIMFYF